MSTILIEILYIFNSLEKDEYSGVRVGVHTNTAKAVGHWSFVFTSDWVWVDQLAAFLLTEGAWVPSLKPFFSLLNTVLKCCILPVPWAHLLFALADQLSNKRVSKLIRVLTSSGLASTTGTGTSVLLLVPVLFAWNSGQGVRLVASLSLSLSSLSLVHGKIRLVIDEFYLPLLL